MSQVYSHQHGQHYKKKLKIAELMQKLCARFLFRPLSADQSEQSGLFGRRALKTQASKHSVQTKDARGASTMDSMRKITHLLNRKAGKDYLVGN